MVLARKAHKPYLSPHLLQRHKELLRLLYGAAQVLLAVEDQEWGADVPVDSLTSGRQPDYISGDRITITVPGGMPLVLTRQGDALEGSVDGESVKFVKK